MPEKKPNKTPTQELAEQLQKSGSPVKASAVTFVSDVVSAPFDVMQQVGGNFAEVKAGDAFERTLLLALVKTAVSVVMVGGGLVADTVKLGGALTGAIKKSLVGKLTPEQEKELDAEIAKDPRKFEEGLQEEYNNVRDLSPEAKAARLAELEVEQQRLEAQIREIETRMGGRGGQGYEPFRGRPNPSLTGPNAGLTPAGGSYFEGLEHSDDDDLPEGQYLPGPVHTPGGSRGGNDGIAV